MKVLVALVLLALASFCAFGILSTFEPVDQALAWRIGYGVGLLACLVGAIQLLRTGSDASSS